MIFLETFLPDKRKFYKKFSLQRKRCHIGYTKVKNFINGKSLMSSNDEKVKVSVLLPKELFDKLEEKAKKSFLRRSSWIIQAITEKITKEEQEKNKDSID